MAFEQDTNKADDVKNAVDEISALLGDEQPNTDIAGAITTAFEESAVAPKKVRKELTPEQLHIAEVTSTAKNKILSASEKSKDTALGLQQRAFTEHARICGYICENDQRTDFALSAKSQPKDTAGQQSADKEYVLKVNNSAPSPYKFVIVRYPTDIKMSINQPSNDLKQIHQNIENPEQFSIECVTKDALDGYMAQYTSGTLYEAAEIFYPFTKKSGNSVVAYTRYEDCKQYPEYEMAYKFPALLRQGIYSKGGAARIVVRHSFRSRVITPNNYICRNEFETLKFPAAMSPAEAETYTQLYLSRFAQTKNDATKICRLNFLTPDQQKHVIMKKEGNGSVIEKNDIFTPDASRSILKDFTVAHWYERDDAGNPKTTTADKSEFALKIMKENAKSPSYVKKELQDGTSADPKAYKFNPTWPVVKATKGLLTFSVLKMTFARKAATKSSSRQQSLKLGGSQLMGITGEAFAAYVEEAKKVG